MYVALSPNYGLCKSAQKNNFNNFVQIAHSDCLNKTINAKSDKYCNLRYHAAPIFSTLSGVLLLWAFSLIRFQGNWYM